MLTSIVIDDSDGLMALIRIQGRAVVSFIRFLIDQDLFVKHSTIRNLGLVLACWIRYNRQQVNPGLEHVDWWSKENLRLADKHGVPIHGPAVTQKFLKKKSMTKLLKTRRNGRLMMKRCG